MFFVRLYCAVSFCYCCRSHPNSVDEFPSIGIVRVTDRNDFDDGDADDDDDNVEICDRFDKFQEISTPHR